MGLIANGIFIQTFTLLTILILHMSISDQNVEILQIADEAVDSYTSSQFQARGTPGWEPKLTLVPFRLIMHNR